MNSAKSTQAEHVFDRAKICEICPMFEEVMTFFEGKTKGQRMASRADFTPLEFKKYLPSMALLELKLDAKDVVSDAFCRVCGSKCALLYGEVNGTWLSNMEPYEIFERVMERCNIVRKNRRELAIKLQILSKDKNYIVVRGLYIPLSNDNNSIEKILIFIDIDPTNGA